MIEKKLLDVRVEEGLPELLKLKVAYARNRPMSQKKEARDLSSRSNKLCEMFELCPHKVCSGKEKNNNNCNNNVNRNDNDNNNNGNET